MTRRTYDETRVGYDDFGFGPLGLSAGGDLVLLSFEFWVGEAHGFGAYGVLFVVGAGEVVGWGVGVIAIDSDRARTDICTIVITLC
ncbi:hypothetical protein DFH08DRAFT_863202 [Mycena albidolilacea]|uniref:Uncharacterized protein n=1 Tax=Mycena albidolilacea TaxID=1033008 RepID=A0AAD7ESZ4_9AGAR|nr:hypothetical protein DFH08DRAFT_863202 [Mycena albidolilacea]